MRARWARPRRASGDRGVSLLIVAFGMVGICAITALVIDMGNARQVRRHSQAAVDAAALAGAQDLPVEADSAATRAVKQDRARDRAMEYAVRDLFSGTPPTAPDCASGVTTCTATVDGVQLTVTTPYDGSISYLHVEACRDTDTFFASVVGQSSPRVCRSAVGRYRQQGGGYDFGLVATDPSKCGALTFAGNSDTILTSNGAVMVNSNCASGNAQALDSSGSSWQLRFVDSAAQEVEGYIGVVGGATLAPCDPVTQTTKCTKTSPSTGISPFGDPLGTLEPPDKPADASTPCPQNGGGTMKPGAYTSCKITNGDVNLEPGIYWFDGGFEMNGGHLVCVDGGGRTCAGDGILLYVNTGGLKLNGNGRVYLPPYRMACAPGEHYKGECLDGLSIWQASTTEASINGTNDFSVGSIYIPNANLKANGNGGGEEVNVNGIVVAKTVEISGTFDFTIVVPTDAPDPETLADLGLQK